MSKEEVESQLNAGNPYLFVLADMAEEAGAESLSRTLRVAAEAGWQPKVVGASRPHYYWDETQLGGWLVAKLKGTWSARCAAPRTQFFPLWNRFSSRLKAWEALGEVVDRRYDVTSLAHAATYGTHMGALAAMAGDSLSRVTRDGVRMAMDSITVDKARGLAVAFRYAADLGREISPTGFVRDYPISTCSWWLEATELLPTVRTLPGKLFGRLSVGTPRQKCGHHEVNYSGLTHYGDMAWVDLGWAIEGCQRATGEDP